MPNLPIIIAFKYFNDMEKFLPNLKYPQVDENLAKVKVDEEKCTGCGTCVENCPTSVFELQEKGGKKVSVVVRNDDCIVCRTCEVTCDAQAVTVIE